jgi:hypothetical protein
MSIYAKLAQARAEFHGRELTQRRLKELLSYCPITGLFEWRQTRPGVNAASKVGTVSGGYLRVSVDGQRHMAHRLAWLYMTGEWPHDTIDHINRDRLDNRWGNLRCLPHRLNAQNQGGRGYHFNERLGKYVAQISTGGRKNKTVIYLGLFDSPERARSAYLAAKKQHHPHFTQEAS